MSSGSRHTNEKIIVLGKLPYSDNAQILRCYSNLNGAKVFFISTSKKGAIKPAMTMPLSILEVITSSRGTNKMERIKEANMIAHSPGANGNPIKSALTFFTAEFLENLIQEEVENTTLFNYIGTQILQLSASDPPPANFPLTFLLGTTQQLGYLPQHKDYTSNSYFDLMEGVFSPALPLHPAVLDQQLSANFKQLLQGYENEQIPHFTRTIRNELLDALIRFIEMHNSHFRKLKSLSVIREVM